MVLNIDLPKEHENALRKLAEQRGLSLEDFALRTLIEKVTIADDETFRRHAESTIRENDELLKRLS